MKRLYGIFRRCLLGGCLLFGSTAAAQPHAPLQRELAALAAGCRARVGIAVIVDHRDTVLVNDRADYPLMSVFKLHQALFVADRLHRAGRSLDEPLRIRRRELLPDTHSPLRDRYPAGDVTLSVRELLRYTMCYSDNNACDVLFRRFGGPRAVERFLRRLGLREVYIRYDEEQMHRDTERCYANRTSPLEAVRLLELLRDPSLAGPARDLFPLLEQCETGRDRLAAPLLGTQAVLGHKTGTGDRNAQGQLIALNDIGYVRGLPNGRSYVIAVFVKDAAESDGQAAALIAAVSERVYRYVCALPAPAEP